MTSLLLACASIATGIAVPALQDAPVLQYNFASGEQGWSAIQIKGMAGKVSVVHDAAQVKVGTGSLRTDYKVASGEVCAAYANIEEGSAAKTRSLSFWVLSDHGSPLVISLQEKDGGRYNAVVYAPKGQWQEVQLSISDFTLSTGAGDPKDPNERLDANVISSVSLMDFDQFLDQIPGLNTVLGISEGERSFCLSDFKFSPKMLPDSLSIDATSVRIDAYLRPQSTWAGIGVGTLQISSTGPLGEKALRADYHIGAGHICGLVKSFRRGLFADAKTLSLKWATAKPTSYIVQLEEEGGAKYNRILTLDGGSKATDNALALSSFTISDDSKDDNGKLDPEKVHQITLLDIGATAGTDQENTIWVGGISAKK